MKQPKPVLGPLMYGISAAASALGISPPTIYRLVRAKKIKLVKIGGRSLISLDEVARLVEHGTEPEVELKKSQLPLELRKKDNYWQIVSSRRGQESEDVK
ncbi:helix-turn-helix domain-containing protein [candidate division KSB1 bacterium]|nr:helix-turn-helix domain-containing protein [candidate division KSB1 bacterium]